MKSHADLGIYAHYKTQVIAVLRPYSVFFLEVKSSQALFSFNGPRRKDLVLTWQKHWIPAMQRDNSTDFISLEIQNLVARILHGA